jgi:hypothetical protein
MVAWISRWRGVMSGFSFNASSGGRNLLACR